jgi:glycosyltransferase involved in cell wall biosynthesis
MSSINPYDLLNVNSNSDLKELKKNYYQLSLYCHPDKGGSEQDMITIQNAYEYIKNQLQNSTDKTYEELEQEFQEFCKIQEKKPPKFCKIFSETHEEWSNAFNNTYSNQRYSNIFDKGYGGLMDKSDLNSEDYKPECNQKNTNNFCSDIVIYQDPNPTPVDIDNNMPLDKKEIMDFTYKGMSDYKNAFSEVSGPKIELRTRTLEDIIQERNNNKKIAIIYNNSKFSGNYFTALRISKYFNQSLLLNCNEKINDEDLQNIDHVIVIHLFKCYEFLKELKKPYTIIFSGTDCNYYQILQPEIYKSILLKSKNIVTFNSSMESRIKNIYNLNKKIHIIPQSVDLSFEKEDLEYQDYYIWVGKLRAIKNPELLIDIANLKPDLKFLMIGDMDKDYKDLEFPSNVKYLGSLNRNLVLNYINNAIALINTSNEEGMSDTILSAMGLGIPVIARNNTGNSSIINEKTGYLFNTVNDFNKIKIEKKITLNAKVYIHNKHSLSNENLEYQKIIN